MSYKMPLDIRQRFTTKRKGKNISLICDHCGLQMTATDMKALRIHSRSHYGKYYSVAQVGEQMVASSIDYMSHEGVVKRDEDALIVHVRADNLKHAIVKGEGLIRVANQSTSHYRTWRDNFSR